MGVPAQLAKAARSEPSVCGAELPVIDLGCWHGSPRSSDARRRSWPQEATLGCPLLGEQDGSNQTICPSSATALREPELSGVMRPSATRCHYRGPYLSRNAMTDPCRLGVPFDA